MPAMTKGKFGFLREVREPQPAGEQPEAPGEPAPEAPTRTTAAPRRRGRPRGKRSDKNFTQVTIYIRRQTHRGAKLALMKSDERHEFSELVEQLVGEWLGRQ